MGAARVGAKKADIVAATPGKGLRIAEGTNAKLGVLTLNGTTAVEVRTTAVTDTSRIFLTAQSPAGTPSGIAYVTARTPGQSFQVKGAAGDTSTVAWLIVDPA